MRCIMKFATLRAEIQARAKIITAKIIGVIEKHDTRNDKLRAIMENLPFYIEAEIEEALLKLCVEDLGAGS